MARKETNEKQEEYNQKNRKKRKKKCFVLIYEDDMTGKNCERYSENQGIIYVFFSKHFFAKIIMPKCKEKKLHS